MDKNLKSKPISFKDAIKECIGSCKTKFDSSIDLCVHLGVDPKQADQMIKGMSYLPGGTGKTLEIAVFDDVKDDSKLKAAGAKYVGLEDLIEKIKLEKAPFFDICVASPDAMKHLRSVSRILGPRGLMPNLKLGTISTDLVGTVKNISLGSVKYKVDKKGHIHCSIGRSSLGDAKITENFIHLANEILALKPQTSKGKYLKKVYVSSTMGKSFEISVKEIERGI